MNTKKLINYLLLLFMSMGLVACGGGSDSPAPTPTPTPPPTNTAASFSGNLTGSIDEDDTDPVTGVLNVTDPDANEASVQAQTNTVLTYGSFSIDTAGQWSYTLDNSNAQVQALNDGVTVTESITVSSVDGTTQVISITITGVNDDAVLGTGDGVNSASVDSDDSDDVTGTLSLTDADTVVDSIVAQSNTTGVYGTFSITELGEWTYTLDTNNSDVANLNDNSAPLSEEITVQTADGLSTLITITINGVASPPASSELEKGKIGDNDTVPEINCTTTVTSTSALEAAASFTMTPGETLCLANGEYTGLDLEFGGTGTADQPITIAAETSGGVSIDGEVFVGMTGEYVTLQGFIFKDGSVDNSVIQTRSNSNTPCNNCRITENSIIDMDAGNPDSSKWVLIYGANNRIDHNWFSGKVTRGALLVIDRFVPDGVVVDDNFEKDRAQIDHNYFGDRPPRDGRAYADSSDNEYEVIRIGTSDSHTGDSFSVVEHNYFESIDGEAEIISNKSGNNIIRHNTVRNSRGSIVSRHGEFATISNNFIIGDDNPFSGGIRVVDANHTVTNNYIEGARYLATNWNGGIVLTSSNGSTTNGYQDLENVLVANNTIVDSVNSLNVFGGRENTKPDSVYFVNNIIADAIGPVIKNSTDMPTNSTFAGNTVFGQSLADDASVTAVTGMNFVDSLLEKDNLGLFRPSASSPDLSADSAAFINGYTLPLADMDGQIRSAATLAGADEVLTSVPADEDKRGILTAALVGPLNYTPPVSTKHVAQVEIANHDFDAGDLSSWTSNLATLTTETSEVFSRGNSLKLQGASSSASQTVTLEPNTNYTFSAFVKGAAKLSVDVNGTIYSSDENSSGYTFSSVSFNSGSASSAVVSASLDDEIVKYVDILNNNFDDGQDNWTVVEGTGIGQVQDSSNSASGADGSIKFKYNVDDSGTPHDPYIAQTVTVEPNVDYTLSLYVLEKDNKPVSVTFGAHAGDASTDLATATILASKESIYSNLSEDTEADDSFRFDSLSFNSGANTSVTIYTQYNGKGDGSDMRVDDYELTSLGAPSADQAAYFDSFRLVSHNSLN